MPFVTPITSIAPNILPEESGKENVVKTVNWGGLFLQSTAFMMVEQGFRYATEKGARTTHQPFIKGYLRSVGNMHGWSDGDPFLVNYVGHPMQGAVSGYIWAQNDRQYRGVEFGKNAGYWRSRLRAAAYSFIYSELFELGPFSEASIGNTQAFYPQQGFVDQIVTPVVGLGWMVAEDAMDKYVITMLERKFKNPWVLLTLRGFLNPSRSWANLMRGEVPWLRDTRADLFPGRFGTPAFPEKVPPYKEHGEVGREPAPFELATVGMVQNRKGGPCTGGGASAGLRFAPQWMFVVDVHGCGLTGLPTNFSGDSLTYMAGLRWTPEADKRWQPYVEVLAGGNKVTQEEEDPAKKALVEAEILEQNRKFDFPDHMRYTRQEEVNGFAVAAGTGLNLRMNRALALRIAGVSYNHSWNGGIGGRNAVALSSGVILRMGTW